MPKNRLDMQQSNERNGLVEKLTHHGCGGRLNFDSPVHQIGFLNTRGPGDHVNQKKTRDLTKPFIICFLFGDTTLLLFYSEDLD